MKQAIAGLTPADVEEVAVVTAWPSIAAYRFGRFLGSLCGIQFPGVYIFRLGNLFALISILPAIFLYFYKLFPRVGTRYCLTNRRIVVQKGMRAMDDRAIELDDRAIKLDEFDSIEVDVLPGQQWFHAGDLVFMRDSAEVFRLQGVSRPAALRQSCMKSRMAFVGVKETIEQQAASA